MKVRELTDAEVIKVYQDFVVSYFPEDEVKPLQYILKMRKEDQYKVLGIYEKDVLMATAFMATYPEGKSYLLDYLATEKKVRSSGFGSKMLNELLTGEYTDGKLIMIETEALETAKDEEEYQIRVRRNHFYQKNQAKRTRLQTKIFGVLFDIWTLSNAPEGFDACEEMTNIYRYMIPQDIYEQNIVIPIKK